MNFPIIDSHQHIWNPSKAHYDWLGPDFATLYRSFEFEELLPELETAGIDFTIQVQSADNKEDTQLMRDSASKHEEVAGIVGYAPIHNAAQTAETLNSWKNDELMVGVRTLIHNQKDPHWILRDDVSEGLSVLEVEGFTFDLVSVIPDHLRNISVLSERFPNLRIVIDHLSKPPVGSDDSKEWKELISIAASNPLVYAKVSGLYSSVGNLEDWSTESIRPYFEYALDVFGPERLMYGGDWPISLLAGGYTKVWEGLQPLFQELSKSDREQILGRTAF